MVETIDGTPHVAMLSTLVARAAELAAGVTHKPGDRVMARWSDGQHYPATVRKVSHRSTHVEWDDDGAPVTAVRHTDVDTRHPGPMSYRDFARKATVKQLQYIDSERHKMNKLDAARRKHMPVDTEQWKEPEAYKAVAKSLNLHPLHSDEINERKTELDQMTKRVGSPEHRAQIKLFHNIHKSEHGG